MPIIIFSPSQKSIEVPVGTTVFEAARRAGLPVASSCDAELVCGRCNVQILHGAENLSARTDLEVKLLRKEKKPLTDRISCGAFVHGDCTVTATYW